MLRFIALLFLVAVSSARHCKNITVPVHVTSRNGVFNYQPPTNQIDITNYFLDNVTPGNNITANYLTGYKTVSGDYKLAATYCEPDSGPGHALQILTHGVGFDRHYWDFAYNNYNYSYVNRALDAGYSTLSWDRLGIAESSHGKDPVNEIQLFHTVAALKELTNVAKGGHLCGVPTKFEKTIHIGHSFGSIITNTLSAMYPDITKAIVLTGFSQVGNYLAYFALGAHFVSVKEIPVLAKKYALGYLAPDTTIGVQINFFGPKNFDPKMLEVAGMTGQPVTYGELFTLGSGPAKNDFPGPVLIITGDRDVPFCGGNCTDTSAIQGKAKDIIEYSRPNFGKASVFESNIVPDAGHGINYNYAAPGAYKTILDFTKKNV